MSVLLMIILNICSLLLMTVCTSVLIQNSVQSKVAKCFSTCQLLTVNWIICHILDVLSENTVAKLIINNIGYISVCSIGTVFLLFSLYYIRPKIADKFYFRLLLFAPAIFLYFLELTDPVFNLFFDNFGFYLTVIFNYVLLIIGVSLMLTKNIRQFRERIPQIILISLTAIFPIIANLISITDLFGSNLDFTPFSFSLSSILIFLAIYKYEFISVNPFAAKHLLSAISEAIIITNNKSKIIYCNEQMEKYFMIDDNSIYKSVEEVFNEKIITRLSSDKKDFITLINSGKEKTVICIDSKKYYNVTKSAIIKSKGIVYYLYIFSDVTANYEFTNTLSQKNRELTEANQRLIQLNVIEKKLAVERERNRIAQELHDTMGHGLVSVMTLLKLVDLDKSKSEKNTAEALAISSRLLDDVRKCVSGIEQGENISAVHRLEKLVADTNRAGEIAELSIVGEEGQRHIFASEIIYKSAREAVTNSIRHGKADIINIIVKFSKDFIMLYVIDNGTGCSEISQGHGLKGITNRVREIGGKVNFTSFNENGFTVKITIPVGEKAND